MAIRSILRRVCGKDRHYHVHSNGGGLGDELMTFCAVQAAARCLPAMQFVFHSRNPLLFSGAPLIRGVKQLVSEGQRTSVGISYANKHPLPILRQMAKQLGVPNANDFRLELPERQLTLPKAWPSKSGVTLVVQTSASNWTPNKQWPHGHWSRLIESLPHEISIVELGANPVLTTTPRHPGWLTLAGQTSLDEFEACLRAATVFAGPVSSGMHYAHAFSLPSVIMVGGYEAANFPYPLAIQLGTNMQCAPCWLRSPCPYDRECLREISVEMVRSAIMTQISTALNGKDL